jgi:N-acetylglucosaminyldiphosphoundecaprenol N-acetyl-beta-D-mannosaminyltransferase
MNQSEHFKITDLDGGPFKETSILNIPLANLDYAGVVEKIIHWSRSGQHRYIGVCNVHSTTSAAWTPGLLKALVEADLNTADGMPLVWMQRLMGYKGASRVYGPTLMLETLKIAVPLGLRIAFYGGHPERLPVLLRNLRECFPEINIVESISPPFRELSEEEDQAFTRRLNEARPDIVWVGIGCPKQEKWMHAHRSRIPGVMVGVGAAFDFHAGAVAQAPTYLQRLGLEWAYRFYREPRRLYRRYLVTNPVFIGRAILQLWNRYVGRGTFIELKKA